MNKSVGYVLIDLGGMAVVGTPLEKLWITTAMYNFEPADFSDLLFATYDYCVRLDEVSQKAPRMIELALLALPVYSRENLIFTNKSDLVGSLNAGRGAV